MVSRRSNRPCLLLLTGRTACASGAKVDEVRHAEEPEKRAPGPGKILALTVVNDHRIGQLIDPAPGGQPDCAVVKRVLHPVGVPPVGQGNAKAIAGAKHAHRGAIDGTSTSAHMGETAELGKPPSSAPRDLVRDRAVEAGQPTPATLRFNKWPRLRDRVRLRRMVAHVSQERLLRTWNAEPLVTGRA